MGMQVLGYGIYDSVEYIPAGSWNTSEKTVIRFADGSTCVVYGEHLDMPYPKGTHIEVERHYKFLLGTYYNIRERKTDSNIGK